MLRRARGARPALRIPMAPGYRANASGRPARTASAWRGGWCRKQAISNASFDEYRTVESIAVTDRVRASALYGIVRESGLARRPASAADGRRVTSVDGWETRRSSTRG